MLHGTGRSGAPLLRASRGYRLLRPRMLAPAAAPAFARPTAVHRRWGVPVSSCWGWGASEPGGEPARYLGLGLGLCRDVVAGIAGEQGGDAHRPPLAVPRRLD